MMQWFRRKFTANLQFFLQFHYPQHTYGMQEWFHAYNNFSSLLITITRYNHILISSLRKKWWGLDPWDPPLCGAHAVRYDGKDNTRIAQV
jgi:hypothetical protein